MADKCVAQWGRSLVVVTGASRGFGAVLCKTVVGRLGPGSLVVGLARDVQKLQQLGEKLAQVNSAVKFVALEADLSSPDVASIGRALEGAVEAAEGGAALWQTALLVHNAGSLGPTHYMSQLNDFGAVSKYFDLNVSSIFPLNAVFVDQAKALKKKNADMKITVVNVSSLCAVVPMKSWSLYCSGKAARDMVFKVLAAEDPDLMVLNYAPGPLDTDMQKQAREDSGDPELKASFEDMHRQGALLSSGQSVAKLLAVLDKGTFKSGDHVDYYDE